MLCSELLPCFQHVLAVFGPERCMFGSDWPVCLAANATYHHVYELAQELLSHLPQGDRDKIFGLNCVRFYGLKL